MHDIFLLKLENIATLPEMRQQEKATKMYLKLN